MISPQRQTGYCRMLLLVVCCCLSIGCRGKTNGKEMGTVTGKITVEGQPLANARVNYVSSQIGAGASGELKEDGTYTLEGPIPVGTYKVFLTPPGLGDIPAGDPRAANIPTKLTGVAKKYQSAATTGWTAQVKAGKNEFNFDVKK